MMLQHPLVNSSAYKNKLQRFAISLSMNLKYYHNHWVLFCSVDLFSQFFIILDINLGSLIGGLAGFGDDLGSDDDEDLSGLPPELKQLREKERRSANNAREVSCNA